MAITAGNDILASDFISASAGAGSSGQVPKLNAAGVLDPSFVLLCEPYTARNSIAAGDPVAIVYNQSDGGILLDNHSETTSNSGANPTVSFAVASNSNRALVAFIISATTISAVSYNGVAMTLIDSQTNYGGNGWNMYSYYLNAPATGTNTLAITGTSSSYVIAVRSYYNVSQSGQPEAHSKATSGSATINTVANGALVVTGAGFNGASTPTPVNITGAPNNFHSAVLGDAFVAVADSGQLFYQPVTDAVTNNFTGGGGGGVASETMQMSLAPYTAPTQSGYVDLASGAGDGSGITPNYTNAIAKAFIGFALSTVSAGQSVNVQYAGVVTGLSGLVVGTQYFLGNTPGTIGTSAGTVSRKVGIALTATTLLITNTW